MEIGAKWTSNLVAMVANRYNYQTSRSLPLPFINVFNPPLKHLATFLCAASQPHDLHGRPKLRVAWLIVEVIY